MKMAFIQDDALVAELDTRSFIASRMRVTNLTVRIDEERAPEIISATLQGFVALLEEIVIRRESDKITVPFTERESVLRRVHDAQKLADRRMLEMQATLDVDLDIGNSGANTALWRGQCLYTFQQDGFSQSEQIPIIMDTEIELDRSGRN